MASASVAGVNVVARAALRAAGSALSAPSPLAAVAAAGALDAAPARSVPLPMTINLRTGTLRTAVQVPRRSDLPPLPRFFQKKFRLHAHWKLRPVHVYKRLAPFITSLKLSFDPAEEGTSGCKELRRQANAPKARLAFPRCAIECEERSDGRGASVSVTWSDAAVQVIDARHATFLDILDQMASKAQALRWAEEDKEM